MEIIYDPNNGISREELISRFDLPENRLRRPVQFHDIPIPFKVSVFYTLRVRDENTTFVRISDDKGIVGYVIFVRWFRKGYAPHIAILPEYRRKGYIGIVLDYFMTRYDLIYLAHECTENGLALFTSLSHREGYLPIYNKWDGSSWIPSGKENEREKDVFLTWTKI